MASTWTVRAFKASSPSNSDPIKMRAGDLLETIGDEDDGWIWCRHAPTSKQSWVPLSSLSVPATEGNNRTALVEYDATELPVESGECFQAVKEERGWLWCQNSQGMWGWVRLAHVDRIDPS